MSSFGHARGCDFVYEDCIQDGQIPEWSEGFFCNTLLSEKKLQCDPNHAHITFCDLVDYDTLGFAVAPNRKQRYFPGKPVSCSSNSLNIVLFLYSCSLIMNCISRMAALCTLPTTVH